MIDEEHLALDDKHQQLLHVMMRVKAETCLEVFQIARKMEIAFEIPQLESMIRKIKKSIKFFRLDIDKVVDEETEEEYYVFHNMVDNFITRLSSLHKTSELEFFKDLTSAIVKSPCGYISHTEAVNIRNALDERNVKLTATECQNLVRRWINDKYLAEKKDKRNICLGVRSLAELASYLREYFPHNVAYCNLCKTICIQGVNCPHLNIKLHHRCAEKYFESIKNCPECST